MTRERPNPAETRARYQRAKEVARDDIRALVAELVPGGKLTGGRLIGARAHWRGDRHGGSLLVHMAGDKAGGFIDYATGETGDLLHLVQLARRLPTLSDAVRWLEDRYGIRRLSEAERAEFERRAAARREKQERADAARAAAASRDARQLWDQGKPLDLAAHFDHAVMGYFRARACPLEDVPNLATRSFRIADSLEWWMWPAYRDAMGRRARRFPALISRFVGLTAAGAWGGRSVHCTFVARDGSGKAAVPEARLAKLTARGISTEGLIIPVADGPTGLDEVAAVAADVRDTVIVTEGIEDAVTLAIAAPDCRVIAAGSLWGVCSMPDLVCAGRYILARDNDWHAGEARDLFDRAVARLKTTGQAVEVIASPVGKDFNDLARETW